MINPIIVTEIKRLLAEGTLSQRAIGHLTGVSRGTVCAVASGRRPDYSKYRRANEESGVDPNGPKMRCNGCGGMVVMPCLACRDRVANKGQGMRSEGRETKFRLELNLRPEHQARLDEVHQSRDSDPQSPFSKLSKKVPADRAA